MIPYRTTFAATLISVLSFAASDLAAQSAYTVQGFGPTNSGYGVYPQVMNEAGDVAGYYYPGGGYYRPFVNRGGVFADIGTLGGDYSWATDINASGVVVGYSYLTNNTYQRAFLYDGTIHDLGTLGGNYSYAQAINAAGQVVGTSDGHAFRYSGGVMQRLSDFLPANSGWSYLYDARDINDAGQITGRGYHSSLGSRAYLFTPASGSSPATIVTFGNSYYTDPYWINASGQVAGQIYDSSYGGTQAFLFTPGLGGGTLAIIPTLGGTYTSPSDLNDAGQVVGTSSLSNNSSQHAFLYSSSTGLTIDLGTAANTTYSSATAINNSGAVIGYSNGPFLYTGGVMRRLRSLADGCNWSVYDARTINNAAQIAGYGYESNVGARGFIMTPVSGQPTTTLVTSNASGSYRRPIQLQARVTAACSSLNSKTVAFSLNGTSVGSAQTGDDGWARLSTTVGNIVVGNYPDGVAAAFAGDAEFDAASDTASLSVFPASPVITWNPAAIVTGTPLGASQLNATADTPGTFYYSNSAGTVLGAGLQRLYLSFYPTDTTNYYSTSAQALLAVRASNPVFSFTAQEIGGLGGTYTEMMAFNNGGQAVGYSYLPGNSSYRAFLFSNGTTTDLGTLGGQYSQATDVNDAGKVTGSSLTARGYQSAFLYNGSAMTDLGALLQTNSYSDGRAINAAGDVALSGPGTSGYQHAFLYANGTMSDLGTLSGGYNYSYPTDVNASRHVVGYSYPNYSCYHAFLATTTSMQDLGTLGGNCSLATAINDAGHIIGWAQNTAGRQRAFVFKDGQMIDLGTLGGDYATATAINSDGVITGWSYTANNSQLHAFRYADGVMTDLGVINYYSQASDINDAGSVVGWSYSQNYDQTGFLHASGALHDVNALINVGETAGVNQAHFVNNPGQILARSYASGTTRWYVLTPTTIASSSLALTASAGVFRGITTLTATLSVAAPAGAPVQFKLNGTVVGTAQADAQGVARLENISLGLMNAGTHAAAASASFPGNVDYSGSTAAADVVISKAVPAIAWPQPGAITYLTPLSSTQLNATTTVAGQFSFSPAVGTVLQVGAGQTLQVAFTPSDAINYDAADASVTIDVVKATPVVTWGNPAAIVYGTLLGGAQQNATANVPGVFTYSPSAGTKLNAGNNQTLAVSFVPTDTSNYSDVPSTTVVINVSKGTPTVNWSNPADIIHGTLLTATQLNATASVPGAFTYTPAAGTKLNAGNGQVLSVSFTPTDTSNYNGVAATTAAINVAKATATVTWSTPADITYGALLSATQLSATADAAGTFSYTPAVGTKLNAGTGQALSVTFTPTDSSNYHPVPVTTVSINVAKASPTLIWTNPAAIVYGTVLGGGQLGATANVPGQFVYAPVAGTLLNAGAAQTLGVTFTPTDTTNYHGASKAVALTVTPAPLTITAGDKSMVLNDAVPALTAAYNGFVNGETSASLTQTVSLATAATGTAVGTFPITASGAASVNYTITYVPGNLTVSYATGLCRGQVGHQVLEPVNLDGSSVFRRSSTVPVKFRVCDVNGNSIASPGVVSTFAMVQVLAGTISADLEAIDSTTPDTAFRWDATAQQWIFNLSTKSQSVNRTYVYRITLADRSVIDFRYGLR